MCRVQPGAQKNGISFKQLISGSTRTDALHVLALNGDDLKRLSFEQKAQSERFIFLMMTRPLSSAAGRGSVLTREDVSVFDDMGSGRRL